MSDSMGGGASPSASVLQPSASPDGRSRLAGRGPSCRARLAPLEYAPMHIGGVRLALGVLKMNLINSLRVILTLAPRGSPRGARLV